MVVGDVEFRFSDAPHGDEAAQYMHQVLLLLVQVNILHLPGVQ